jgi:tetratricopeptide (TPR) repeat protein
VLDARRRINGPEHPLTIAALRATAWQLSRLGHFEKAENRFSEAIDLYKRVFGEDHPEYLGCLGDSVVLYCLSDQLERAEERQRDVLATCRRVLGDEHPWTLDARNGLGIVFQRQGRYEDADENLSTVLAIRRRLLGEEDPATLGTYNNLGWLRQQQSRFGEAAELHARTLEARRRVLGEDHLDTVQSMHSLAIQYSMLGRYDDAERLLLVVLERRVAALGNTHPDTMDARQVLGITVLRGGRIDEGREILERANTIAQAAKREETREGLLTMHHLGEAYQLSRRFSEAEALYRRAIAAAPHVLSAEHPELLYPMIKLGWLYNEQKRFAEAEEILARSLEIRRRVIGEAHLDTIRSMENLAVSLRGLGKVDELRSLLAELIAARQALAEKGYASSDDLNEYAWLLLTADPADLRDPAAALPVAERAAQMSARTNANVLDTLAHAQRMNGAYDQAASTYGEAATLVYSGDFDSNSRDEHSVLEGMVTLIGSARDAGDMAAAQAACLVAEDSGRKLLLKRTAGEHELSDAARNFLGMVLLQCGEPTEAESLIRESLEHRMKLLPEDHWLIGNSMSLLGEALFGQGRFEDAEALLVEGYEKLRKDAAALEDRRYDALERIVRFYEEWNATDPEQGHAEKVAEYRAMLSAYPVRPPCYCERPMAAASTVPNGRFRSPYSHLGEFSKAEPLLVQTNELAMRVYPNGDSRLVAQAERWRQQARSENSDERARSGPSP